VPPHSGMHSRMLWQSADPLVPGQPEAGFDTSHVAKRQKLGADQSDLLFQDEDGNT
jgi:hypothetical protein